MIWFVVFREKSRVCQFFSRGGWALFCLLLVFASCGEAAPQEPALSGRLVIVGSTALQPLTAKAADMFMKQYPHTRIDVSGGGSIFGLDAVTNQQADIGESDIYADPTVYPDPDLADHIVCIIPFTMVVNPDVPIRSLTQDQIIQIFATGTLRNWQDLGGPDLPIVPIVRSDLSGTRATFLRYVLNGYSERTHLKGGNGSPAVAALVARTQGAIGYLALSALIPGVHQVSINNVAAKPETIAEGRYTFWGYEHMYTMNSSHQALLSAFLSYMLTPPVQDLAQLMGYIPLAHIQFPTQTAGG